MNGKILIVDDETSITSLITIYLENENLSVITCANGEDAIQVIDHEKIDLAVLDVMLPGRSGFEICNYIREHDHHYPVIMLTARDEELDKINGLTLGADDYVTKPFNPLELVARIKAQLRRANKYNDAKMKVYSLHELEVYPEQRKVLKDEQEIVLTPIEFKILLLLFENKGKVVSSEEIFQSVWEEKYFSQSSNTVMVHIRHLREKLGDTIDNPKFIKTVWGVGYKVG